MDVSGWLFARIAVSIQVIILTVLLMGSSNPVEAGTPERIVSLAPHITEIIYRLGAGQRLVGRSEFCDYPPAALKCESVGGYLDINFEKIVSLKPDLVLMFPNQENRRKLQSLGLRVAELPNETIAQILESITQAGELLQLTDAAMTVRKEIEDTLHLVQAIGENVDKHPSAMLVVGRERESLSGLYLAGKNTYLNELWKMCGGVNAFLEVSQRYFSVNKEDIVKRDIDAILEFHPGWELSAADRESEKKVWNLFTSLPAVKRSHIYLFTDKLYVIPGPRITRIAMTFSRIIQNLDEGEDHDRR